METARSVREAFDLTGRVALVTGAGGSIGRTTAEVLAGAGATVVCADIDAAAASETASAILGQGGRAESAQLDVSQRRRGGEPRRHGRRRATVACTSCATSPGS